MGISTKISKHHSWQCIKHTKHRQHLLLYCVWHRPNWSVVDAESAKGEKRTRDHRPQTRSGPPTLKKPEYVKEERAPSLLYTLPATGQRKVEALSLSLSLGRKEAGRASLVGRHIQQGWTTVEVDREGAKRCSPVPPLGCCRVVCVKKRNGLPVEELTMQAT